MFIAHFGPTFTGKTKCILLHRPTARFAFEHALGVFFSRVCNSQWYDPYCWWWARRCCKTDDSLVQTGSGCYVQQIISPQCHFIFRHLFFSVAMTFKNADGNCTLHCYRQACIVYYPYYWPIFPKPAVIEAILPAGANMGSKSWFDDTCLISIPKHFLSQSAWCYTTSITET